MGLRERTSPPRTARRSTGPDADPGVIDRVARRAFYLCQRMIHDANHRKDKAMGDPKIGGHPAACASSVHILSALHLVVREPQDFVCCKPHASPVDHALHFLLGLFRSADGSWMGLDDAKAAMTRLRKFPSHRDEPVFQSYHAESDPDSANFFPSGSVGIPPVVSIYTALAYRYARDHGWDVPGDAHFWSLIGDSEFREGSLMEAMPDAAERELGNVTWVIDYNRQNLDGTRLPNERGLRGTDAQRIQRVAEANGWEVIQARHGPVRRAAFRRRGGPRFQAVLEERLSDVEFQMLLFKRDGAATRKRLVEIDPSLEAFLRDYADAQLQAILEDLGGHDVAAIAEALLASRRDQARPTLVIAHTIKGWGLGSFANPGNHSTLCSKEEIARLMAEHGATEQDPYPVFPEESSEGRYLAERREKMRLGFKEQAALRERNLAKLRDRMGATGPLPESLDVDLALTPVVHTQYMWGQLAAKLIRIGGQAEERRTKGEERPLTDLERRWTGAADLILTLAPDVGTSTQMSPAMDQKIYAPTPEFDLEDVLKATEVRRVDLIPSEEAWTRHIRFEIAEANAMSCAGAFGKMAHHAGVPLLPIMTIYDFFIKRAYDQLYYNLYWKSGFIVVGTPSGVTLSPEGAQHSWKSDIQFPNLVTWEPFFAREVDWIVAETIRRHVAGENEGRQGVVIRCVTRGIRQADLLLRLRRQRRFKKDLPEDRELSTDRNAPAGAMPEEEVESVPDAEILEAIRRDALEGGYRLVDYRGYHDYEPGDNVVQIFAMGAVGTEAVAASDRLLQDGIYANVIVVTSPDLLLGTLAYENEYRHLRQGLAITGDLHLPAQTRAELSAAAARRIPIVSVHDGEPGLLDNIGSVVGVKQIALAVRKPSKSGRPAEVYRYHHIDADAVHEAALRVLEDTAREQLLVSRKLMEGR